MSSLISSLLSCLLSFADAASCSTCVTRSLSRLLPPSPSPPKPIVKHRLPLRRIDKTHTHRLASHDHHHNNSSNSNIRSSSSSRRKSNTPAPLSVSVTATAAAGSAVSERVSGRSFIVLRASRTTFPSVSVTYIQAVFLVSYVVRRRLRPLLTTTERTISRSSLTFSLVRYCRRGKVGWAMR